MFNFLCAFNYSDLFKNKGLIARCIAYALLISHGIRKDTSINILIRGYGKDYSLIRLIGRELRHLRPDERTIWGILNKALIRPRTSLKELRVHWGVYIIQGELDDLKDMLRCRDSVVIRKTCEMSVFNIEIEESSPMLFIFDLNLSTLTANEYEALGLSNVPKYAIGDIPLDQAIAIVNWILDNKVRRWTSRS